MLELISGGVKTQKPAEPKYAALLDYMDKQSGIASSDLAGVLNTSGGFKYRVNMAKGNLGSMQGSPWQSGCPVGTNTGRAIQHPFPSQEVFERLRSEARLVFLQVNFGSFAQFATSLPGLDRNGYVSGSTTVAKGVTYVRFETNPSLVYYDSVADQLYSMYGSGKTGPTVWTPPA